MKSIILPAVIISILAINMHSQAKDEIGNSENNKLILAVLDFKTENCDPELGADAAQALNNALRNLTDDSEIVLLERDIIITSAETGKFSQADCYNNINGCVLPADKKVTGLLTRNEYKSSGSVGKYVVKESAQEEFSVNVKVYNEKNHIDLNIKENIPEKNDIEKTMKKIAVKIINYYTERIKKKKKETEAGSSDIIKLPFKSELYGLSASPVYMYSIAEYKDIANYGLGFNLNAHCKVIPFPGFITFSFDMYSMNDTKKSIDSCYVLYPLIKIGRSFPVYQFTISPYAGPGYVLSIIKGDKNGMDAYGKYDKSTDFYYNFSLSAGAGIDYRINDNYFLSANPSYSIFFEEKEQGQFLTLSIGFGILL